jgi:prephenate dehydrogenase
MTNIAILGIDIIGLCIALSLKKNHGSDFYITAAGAEPEDLKFAKSIGAADKTETSARKCITDAEIIIMDAPLHYTKDLLENLSSHFNPGATITDTGPLKQPVIKWARELLPSSINFVASRPVPKEILWSLEDVSPDAISQSPYCIVTDKTTSSEGIQTITWLAKQCGSQPYFLDSAEHDSYSSAMALLPNVISSALIMTASKSRSWPEMSKLSTPEFKAMTQLADKDPEENSLAADLNSKDTVHWIDEMIASLYEFRKQFLGDKEKLFESFISAWEQRAKWEAGTLHPDDSQTATMPNAKETMAEMMIGTYMMDRYRKMTDKSRKNWKYFRKS